MHSYNQNMPKIIVFSCVCKICWYDLAVSMTFILDEKFI